MLIQYNYRIVVCVFEYLQLSVCVCVNEPFVSQWSQGSSTLALPYVSEDNKFSI